MISIVLGQNSLSRLGRAQRDGPVQIRLKLAAQTTLSADVLDALGVDVVDAESDHLFEVRLKLAAVATHRANRFHTLAMYIFAEPEDVLQIRLKLAAEAALTAYIIYARTFNTVAKLSDRQ